MTVPPMATGGRGHICSAAVLAMGSGSYSASVTGVDGVDGVDGDGMARCGVAARSTPQLLRIIHRVGVAVPKR